MKSVKYKIEITRGKEAGTSYPLDNERITIGRKPENTVPVSDIKVSGVHAEIVFDGDLPVIRDLGSTNGTFLDGKKITEVILSEGDRIMVGGTEFVLLGEGESAPQPRSEVPAADADEVRVIHDTRPARRGMGGLILLLVLLVGLGGAGYYYFFHVASENTFVTLEAARGNLLAEGWSFEDIEGGKDITDLWTIASGDDTLFTRDKENARSGLFAVRVTLGDAGTMSATYSEPIKVNTRRQYVGSIWTRITGTAMVSLQAVFYRSAEDREGDKPLYTDVIVSTREEGAAFTQVKGTVYPPPEAQTLVFKLTVAGQGEAEFDDVEFFERSATTPEKIGTSGGMDFFACQGNYLVRRIGHTLFTAGRLLAMEPAGSGDSAEAPVVHDSDAQGLSFSSEGYLFGGARAGLVRLSHTLEVNADQVEGVLTLPTVQPSAVAEFRYCFDLMDEYAEDGAGVLSSDEFILYGGSFPPVQADALIFGGSHDRVKVTFDRPCTVVGVDRKDGGVSLQCGLKPGTGELKFQYRIQSDFTEEIKQAQSMLQQATRAEQNERYGEALDLIDQIAKRYPYNEAVTEHASALRITILKVKRDWLEDIRERLKSARFLNTPEQYNTLEETCEGALLHFPGDRDFETAREEVLSQGSALLDLIHDEEAERFFLIARNLHQTGGRATTLKEVLDYLHKKYPDSEWTAQADALGQEDTGADEDTGANEDTQDSEPEAESGSETE